MSLKTPTYRNALSPSDLKKITYFPKILILNVLFPLQLKTKPHLSWICHLWFVKYLYFGGLCFYRCTGLWGREEEKSSSQV